jgi:hypothetical protein
MRAHEQKIKYRISMADIATNYLTDKGGIKNLHYLCTKPKLEELKILLKKRQAGWIKK